MDAETLILSFLISATLNSCTTNEQFDTGVDFLRFVDTTFDISTMERW